LGCDFNQVEPRGWNVEWSHALPQPLGNNQRGGWAPPTVRMSDITKAGGRGSGGVQSTAWDRPWARTLTKLPKASRRIMVGHRHRPEPGRGKRSISMIRRNWSLRYPHRPPLAILLAIVVSGASCSPSSSLKSVAVPTSSVAATISRSDDQVMTAIAAPPISAEHPFDLPGLHNVVTYADGLYSGGAPEGEIAFETLAALGVKTIISVDGATPDVEAARAHGLRYVHLPIGYHGMDRSRTLELARAAHDLPGPVYLHCHHGKHRSAGALGATVVSLGLLSPEKAIERMKVSGTAANYTGLYHCVAVATVATREELASASNEFPEVWKTSGLVQTMVEVDEVFERLKAIESAGWSTPRDHPDLVPVAEAGRLADLQRNVVDDEAVGAQRPAEFARLMLDASKLAETLEAALLRETSTPQELSAMFKRIGQSCKECHARHRD